jgi:exopolyphosphatase
MEERGLFVLGILTSFRHEKHMSQSGRGKHKRQMLWVIREGADMVEPSEPTNDKSGEEPGRVDVDQLASKLWDGLEGSEVLQLKKRDIEKFGTSDKDADSAMRIRIYKQGNVNATRKATAPLMKSILQGYTDGKRQL